MTNDEKNAHLVSLQHMGVKDSLFRNPCTNLCMLALMCMLP